MNEPGRFAARLTGAASARIVDGVGPKPTTQGRNKMRLLRNLFIALFRPYAGAKSIKGGSGHYNEQCHPQTYG